MGQNVSILGKLLPQGDFFPTRAGGANFWILFTSAFWLGKGDIPNEKIRLLPLEVHFRVGGFGRTDSAGGAGQEQDEGRISVLNHHI